MRLTFIVISECGKCPCECMGRGICVRERECEYACVYGVCGHLLYVLWEADLGNLCVGVDQQSNQQRIKH